MLGPVTLNLCKQNSHKQRTLYLLTAVEHILGVTHTSQCLKGALYNTSGEINNEEFNQ